MPDTNKTSAFGVGKATPFQTYLSNLVAELAQNRDGKLADYIPELAKTSPDKFAICVATVDGQVYGAGDVEDMFSIQSVSKPFLYGHALEMLGQEKVLEKVGVEPTGDAFNAIVLDDDNNRPFNPMVNAGAIAVADLIDGKAGGGTLDARLDQMREAMSEFAGRALEVDEAVFRSEDLTGDRNRAIAYLMKNSGMISRSPKEVLEVYFRQCSLLITCADLAVMGATLANQGVNPRTGRRVIGEDCVRDVLTIMMSCGMYDYAGGWAFEVGLPAKSGVSGGIVAVLPGQLAVSVWSPPLDEVGNSVRGIAACRRISNDFGLHMFGQTWEAASAIRRITDNTSYRSLKTRSSPENRALERRGHRIAIVELQGALVFASAERLLREIGALSETADYLVLSFRRVQLINTAAAKFLEYLCDALTTLGMELHFSEIEASGLASDAQAMLHSLASRHKITCHLTTDHAIETCEEALLYEMPAMDDTSRLALARLDLFEGLALKDLRELEGHVQPMQFSAGEKILRAGSPPRLFFVIAKGSVSVFLPEEDGARTRIGSLGPGQVFGEMGVLEDLPRSADVIADGSVLAYAMSISMLTTLEENNPRIPIQIYRNLAREFSRRTRRGHDLFNALR